MDAPQKEDTSPLRGHAVDERLQPAQFVPRLDLPLGHGLVRAEDVEVGHEIQRHDGLATQRVDQQVAGDSEKVRAARRDPSDVVRLVGTRQALGDQVVNVETRRTDAFQPCAHGGFMRQHNSLEPFQPNEKLAHPAPPEAVMTTPV